VRRIRLMSDWGLGPFYFDSGDGHVEGIDSSNLAAKFGLPDDVMAAIRAWDKIYQELLDWDDPRGSGWANAADKERYLERGRAAARLLRQHVPADVRIEYCGSGSVPLEYY
jgi:hypothetical protein